MKCCECTYLWLVAIKHAVERHPSFAIREILGRAFVVSVHVFAFPTIVGLPVVAVPSAVLECFLIADLRFVGLLDTAGDL